MSVSLESCEPVFSLQNDVDLVVGHDRGDADHAQSLHEQQIRRGGIAHEGDVRMAGESGVIPSPAHT